MRRMAGTATILLPLAVLATGPWLGLVRVAAGATFGPAAWSGAIAPFVIDGDPQTAAPARSGRTVCNCRTVDVNLRNEVSEAKIKTGDAKVENLSITYVSSTYGDRDVDVDQEAEAVSGDAIAGQLVGVDARGPGCVNVRVHATNTVSDSTLQTGDATAINRSVILLDPGVHRGDLEIDVEQEAIARSGDAIAGQVIGVIGGDRVGGCGGEVDLTAVNDVSDTEVKTGNASFFNDVDIRTCAEVGCAAELAELTGEAEIEVCAGRRCRQVERDELAAALGGATARPDDIEETDLAVAEAEPKEEPSCAAKPTPTPPPPAPGGEPAATDDPQATTPPDASPTPPPHASPAPAPCGDASPAPPEQQLAASGADQSAS